MLFLYPGVSFLLSEESIEHFSPFPIKRHKTLIKICFVVWTIKKINVRGKY